MKTLISLALAVTLPVAALSAQTTGFYPKDRENTNGNTWDNRFPYSQAAPQRSMMIVPRERMIGMNSLDIGIPVPDGKRITRFGFRRSEQHDSDARRLIGEIYMAKGRVDPGSESTTFSDNIEPGTEVLVKAGTPGNFLDLDALNTANPVSWITLDTPYTYDASRALIIDFRITANDNGNQAFNYYLDLETSFTSERTPFGQACAGSGGNVPELTITAGRLGANTQFQFRKGTANTLTGMHLNVDRLMTPITVPSLAGPCELWVNPLAVVGGMTNSSGNLNVNALIPNDLSLFGLTIYAQAFIQDVFANALGFISSNGYGMTIGALPQAASLRSGGDALAVTGSRRRNWGYVMMFEWID